MLSGHDHDDAAALDLLRRTVEQAPQGVLVVDETGRIVAANHSVEDIFGYAMPEIVGRALADLIPEFTNVEALIRSAAGATVSTPGADEFVSGLRRDGASVPLEVGRSLTTAGDARFILLSLGDLTDLFNMQARLVAATNSNLGFQRLVSDIALRLACAESANLDDLIVDSLRQIAEALQLDRAVLWKQEGDEPTATATHYWIKDGFPAPPEPYPSAAIPNVMSKLDAGESVTFSRLSDLPDEIDREAFRAQGLVSGAAVPLSNIDGVAAAARLMTFSSMTVEIEWVPAIMERLRLVGAIISQALVRRSSDASLSRALTEITELRDKLADGVPEVRRDARSTKTTRFIVAESASVKRALAQLEQVATTSATVLLRGETGSGKEVFAQAIHDLSPRHHRPMVVVSCAAIPTALIESELFGRERGAYTGALSRQIGRFEAANQSSLLLDEIGELSMEMQVKLLRVIQERTIERLGSTQPIKVDVRIIAATHRDLEAAVQDGTFREDLFYRLNVFPVIVPPLRERIEDIPGLVWSFVDEFSRAFGKKIDSIPAANLRELTSYSWPGNVRELRNVIERAVILCTGRQLVVPVPRVAPRVPPTAMTLEALEVDHILKVLDATSWRVRGPGGAAARLGLKPTTLESRMARLGISRKRA